MTTVLALFSVAVALVVGAAMYILGWVRGFRAGRKVEAMEPRRDGKLYFNDGPLVSVLATSALDALDQLASRPYGPRVP